MHSLAEQAVFECAFSRPLPASAVQWRFYPASASAARSRTQPAPRVLTSDERVSIEQYESGRVARLVLRAVQLEQQGTFEVTAANATARAALFVDSTLSATIFICSHTSTVLCNVQSKRAHNNAFCICHTAHTKNIARSQII